MKKQKDFTAGYRSGFTIVELLIYSGILTIFLYVLTNMFVSILDTQLESQSTSAVVQDGRFLFSRLAYDIERADELVEPATLGAQSSSLVLRVGGTPYTYAIQNGNLSLTNEKGTFLLNSYGTNISSASFRRYGNVDGKHSIRIAFTITGTTTRTAGPETRNFQTTIGMRK